MEVLFLRKDNSRVAGGRTGSIIDEVFNGAPSQDEGNDNVSKIITEWLSPDHIDKKTRFTPDQVIAVSILDSLAETYDIATLKRFLKAYKTAKLSEGGKSSEELENILRSYRGVGEEENGRFHRLTRFLE